MAIGQISVHSVNAKLEIQSTRSEIDMKQHHAQIQMESELPRITIDQSECFNTAGLKNNTAFIETEAGRAKQKALEYIGTTISDGQMFAAIENPGDASNLVAQIATRNMFAEHEFGVVSMPAARPKIEVTGGSLKIDFTPKDLGTMNGVEYYVKIGKLSSNYIPGSITVDYKI
jgi:hypothetical protein